MTGNTGAGDVIDITEKFDLNKKKMARIRHMKNSFVSNVTILVFSVYSCFVYFQLNTGPFWLECACAFLFLAHFCL